MEAERLLIERARQRLSIQELAERSGVNAHTISEMERGVRKPRAITVAKIADALGLTPEDLLGKAPAPRPSAENRSEQRREPIGKEAPEEPGEVERWTQFGNEWADDLADWAYGFHKGEDPGDLPEQEFFAFVGGLLVTGREYGRAQKIVEPLAHRHEAEDLAKAWRRLSGEIQRMATDSVLQRADEIERDQTSKTVAHLRNLKTA